jgi:hypothetical protein
MPYSAIAPHLDNLPDSTPVKKDAIFILNQTFSDILII